jgi:hypothetical protein
MRVDKSYDNGSGERGVGGKWSGAGCSFMTMLDDAIDHQLRPFAACLSRKPPRHPRRASGERAVFAIR